MNASTLPRKGFARAITALLSCLLLLVIAGSVYANGATPPLQEGAATPEAAGEEGSASAHLSSADCQSCHVDIANHWQDSAHAHAYDDPVFQQQWAALGQPGDCLRCHTTNYEPATGLFAAEGVDCESCHGTVGEEHPPAPVPILADAQRCGDCHTTTLGEWHGSGHATAGIDCMGCHNPHSQQPLFADADQMCLNCHEDTMGEYLEDIHFSKDIGCVDCHALVIPPETAPQDGIVPTGHGFTMTAATCVACHTDALHAGFSLPGYEHGATAAEETSPPGRDAEGVETIGFQPQIAAGNGGNGAAENNVSAEQQVQVLEAALASRRVTTLFQGGLVGLTFGGITAWFVASNLRARREHEDEVDEEEV